MQKLLSELQKEEILQLLKTRFNKNKNRHPELDWKNIEHKLQSQPLKLWSLYQMEQTGGEPDVIDFDSTKNSILFVDCSIESPKDRRSLCYDKEALDSRKEHKPIGSVIESAKNMGIELLDETLYRKLQLVGKFDSKTSSWITTPPEIRKLGGALFADFRYNSVFVYHNGASSYYAARGFRGYLVV